MKIATEERAFIFVLLHIVSLSLVIFSCISELYFLSGYAALALLALSVLCIAKLEKDLFWISLYFIFALSSTVVITVFVEQGVYLWEIKRWSFPSGLTAISWYQVLLVMTGVLFSYHAINRLELRFYSLPPVLRKGAWFTVRLLAIVIIILLFGISIIYGTPGSNGVHRMDYWAYHAPSWGSTLAYWLIQLSFPLGYMFARRGRKSDLVLFFAVLSISIYMGERFTGILLACFFFYMPIALLKGKKPFSVFFSWKGIVVGLAVFCLLSFTLFFSYEISLLGAVDMVLDRAMVQAQMWWALNETATTVTMSFPEILRHYLGIQAPSTDSGVYYLMYQVAPEDVVDYRIDTGSNFTMSGVFNNLYFFGYALGSIVNVIYGAVFGVACGILKKAVQSDNLVVALFSFKLMYKLMVVLLAGKTDQFFTLGNFAFFIIVFFFLKLSLAKNENMRV